MESLRYSLLVTLVSVLTSVFTPTQAEEDFTPPKQFLVDKPTDLAAIVRVDAIENKWVSIEGDRMPFIVSSCSLVEQIGGAKQWPKETVQTVLQSDCTIMIDVALAPPPLQGREYFLWASVVPEEDRPEGFEGDWIAHPQGFYLIRGAGDKRFIYWDQKSYLVSDLRSAIQGETPLPLNEIKDPVKRIQIAEQRIDSDQISDVDALIEGLAINVRDPEGQSKLVQKPQKSEVEEESDFFDFGEGSAHQIWFESLTLLRDLGRKEAYKAKIIDALKPFLKSEVYRIPFVTAIALADLGDNSGFAELIKGYEEESGAVSKISDEGTLFYGRFKYDDSSVLASAYALGRIGDKQGLKHDDAEARLATVDGLMESGDTDVKKTLEEMAIDLDREVKTLEESGVITAMRDPSDLKGRYPTTWIKVHAMLGRLGSDESLEKLVRAWIKDLETYPENDDLLPRSRIVSFDSHSRGWHSLNGAIYATDPSKENLLVRLKNLFGEETAWNEEPLVNLRAAIGDKSAVVPKEEENEIASTKARIEEQLKSDQLEDRAEALAAAGHHKIDDYFQKVLDTALNGEGVEKQASIYALGIYGRPVPEDVLKQLISTGGSEQRLSAFEVATRNDPGRFATEGLELARTLQKDLTAAQGDEDSKYDLEQLVTHATQCLGRVPRNGIPDAMVSALNDPDPGFRKLLVQALSMSGNPDAVSHLKPLLEDKNPEVQEAAKRAVNILGPSGS